MVKHLENDRELKALSEKLGADYEFIKSLCVVGLFKLYVFRSTLLNRSCVMKVMDLSAQMHEFRQSGQKDIREYFENIKKDFVHEAELLKEICDPGIPKFIDIGFARDMETQIEIPYLVLEYFEGETLQHLIENKPPLKIEIILSFSKKILLALDKIHQCELIYGTLESDKILVDQNSKEVILLDFSRSRDEKFNLHFSKNPKNNTKKIAETDIYSFGIVLYEMVLGKKYFGVGETQGATHADKNFCIPTDAKNDKGIPDAVWELIEKTTSRKSVCQYGNALEVLNDIEKISIRERGGNSWNFVKYLALGIVIVFVSIIMYWGVKQKQSTGPEGTQPIVQDPPVEPFEKVAFLIEMDEYLNDSIVNGKKKNLNMVEKELKKRGYQINIKKNLNIDKLNYLFSDLLHEKYTNTKLIICYSGGCYINGNNNAFLVPYDGPKKINSETEGKLVSLQTTAQILKNSKAHCIYFILDCDVNPNFLKSKKDSSHQLPKSLYYKSRQFLSLYNLNSSKKSETLLGLFIGALQNSSADRNQDGLLTATEIGNYLSDNASDLGNQPSSRICFGKLKEFETGEFTFAVEENSAKYFKEKQGPVMVKIPGGKFLMGKNRRNAEHSDEIAYLEIDVPAIAVSCFEITIEDYSQFRKIPSELEGKPGDSPMVRISWKDAIEYTEWLSEKTGEIYRLPTEAEWEYFARAGSEADYWWGNEASTKKANYSHEIDDRKGNTVQKAKRIGSYRSNKFGIFDTVGNVWEWTLSPYTRGLNKKDVLTRLEKGDVVTSEQIVKRGGSYAELPENCRASARGKSFPGEEAADLGFRIIKELD